MPSTVIPSSLRSHPFTTGHARAAGISADAVRGPSFQKLFRGVYVSAQATVSHRVWVLATLLASPPDAVASHMTALRLYGLDLGSDQRLHVSTRTSTRSRLKSKKVVTHRRLHPITGCHLDGIPVTGPDRTLVDIATKVTLVDLVTAAEFMIHTGRTTLEALGEYAMTHHLDGVIRLRRVIGLVREGVESPMESTVRLLIVFARLPEPACNVDILDDAGSFLGRGDLVYHQWKVIVEYDGWHHERDAEQRQHDLVRRERLEAAGWRIVVITSNDLKRKAEIVRRVHRAIGLGGYAGPDPQMSLMWRTWFA